MKLTHAERKLSPQHAAYLAEHAVDVDLAVRLGVYTAETPDDLPAGLVTRGSAACPAIVFPWTVGGETWHQIRVPDDSGLPKYLFEADTGEAVWLVHEARRPVGVLLVEGTKQALAVASLDPDWHVYAMAGCYGWSHEGKVRKALYRIASDLPLVAIIDADMKNNPDVYDAAQGILGQVHQYTKAVSTKVAVSPGTKNDGIDDHLATIDPADRLDELMGIIESATAKLGKRPADRPTADGLDQIPLVKGKLDPAHLSHWLYQRRPYAVGPDYQTLYRYKESKGIYERQWNMGARLLHDLSSDYPYVDQKNTENGLVTQAVEHGRVIAQAGEPTRMIALANGLLDPDTSTLHEPSPDHVITSQWAVAYDPEATCPKIMAYLEEKMPEGQHEAFLDTAARMLDSDRTAQDRVLLLFGPSRSGKSTALGLLAEMVGPEARASVTLHDLGASRFAAAQLVGKALNIANELDHAEVTSSSTFKALTGGDYVMVEEKNERPFQFRFYGLMAFATNEIPSMAGGSDAIVRRLVPIVCPWSFAGEEDESVKEELLAELPGLLNELLRRHQEDRKPVPHPAVVNQVQRSVDRMAAWLTYGVEVAETTAASMSPTEAFDAYNRWLKSAGYASSGGQGPFLERLKTHLGGAFLLSNGNNRTGLIEAKSEAPNDFDLLLAEMGVVENGVLTDYSSHRREEKRGVVVVERRGVESRYTTVHHHWLTNAPASTPAGIAVAFAHLGTLTNRIVAIDIETNGLDMANMRVRTVQLGYRDGNEFHAHVIQIELPDGAYSRENAAAVAAGLEAFEGDLWSYGDFDARALKAGLGIDIEISNVMALHHRADSTEATMASPLKLAFKNHLNVEPTITGDETRSRSTGDPEFLEYAALDAAGLRMLMERWMLDVPDEFAGREDRLARLARSMSDHGLLVDVPTTEAVADELRQEIDQLTARIEELAPGIKPASPKMVGAIEARGVKVPSVRKKRKDGSTYHSKSIGHKALHSDDELVLAVQRWRKLKSGLTALVGAPTKKTKGGIVHNLDDQGRIHGRFNPLGARTSRWSSSGPNLQNIPKSRRGLFVPADGFVFVQADLSQIEYRVAAALSEDPAMAKAYHDGLDFHVYAAQILSGVDEPTPEQRQSAKAVGFGMIYGQSARTGAGNAGITEDAMQERIDAYDGAFPQFADWRREMTRQSDFGLTPANPYGRRFNVPQGAGYMAVNYLCQSTAREVFSDWLLKVADRYEQYLVAVVHDEIVLEVPEAEAALDYVIECAAACSIPGSDIPIVATGALAPNNWSEAY